VAGDDPRVAECHAELLAPGRQQGRAVEFIVGRDRIAVEQDIETR
jgi:hypothetical protein